MVEYLIKAALIITPFIIAPNMDARTPKEIFAFSSILTIILFSFHKGLFKSFNNVWALLFILFCWVSLLMAPNLPKFVMAYLDIDALNKTVSSLRILPDRPVSGMWMFKPMLFMSFFFIYMVLIASLDLTKQKIESFLSCMMWCGFAMAIYIFIQKIGMDQFFTTVSTKFNPDLPALKAPMLGGFLGQSTVVSPFMAMLIPIAIYFKRYVIALVLVAAITLTLSKVAAVSAYLGILFIFMFLSRRYYKIIGTFIICISLAGAMLFVSKNVSKDLFGSLKFASSGRLVVWPDVWKAFLTPQIDGKKHTVTGFGPGTFSYHFPVEYKNRWWQAHNEPLEALFNFGIVGVTLLSLAISSMLSHLKAFREDLTISLLGCLLIVFLCSLGTFSLQIAPIYLYVVTILGFLHNPFLRRES